MFLRKGEHSSITLWVGGEKLETESQTSALPLSGPGVLSKPFLEPLELK